MYPKKEVGNSAVTHSPTFMQFYPIPRITQQTSDTGPKGGGGGGECHHVFVPNSSPHSVTPADTVSRRPPRPPADVSAADGAPSSGCLQLHGSPTRPPLTHRTAADGTAVRRTKREEPALSAAL